MMDLSTIQKGKVAQPRRTMLYGTHGLGKSTWAASAPGAIFISTEDGLGDIDCESFPLCKSFADVMGCIRALYESEHSYKTVVIDSLDWAERLIWQVVCDEKKVQSIEDIGYAKGYTFAVDQWNRVLTGLNALRAKGMSAVLLAHSQIEKFEDPTGASYDRYSPRLHKKSSALVQEWCDEVLFCQYRVHTVSHEEGFNRKREQGIGDGERVVRTEERPGWVAKNRLRLPAEMPLDWSAYATHFPGAKPPKKTTNVSE